MANTTTTNPYTVLGAKPDQPFHDIRKQWVRLLLQSHPDKAGEEGKEKCQKLIDAFRQIRDEHKEPPVAGVPPRASINPKYHPRPHGHIPSKQKKAAHYAVDVGDDVNDDDDVHAWTAAFEQDKEDEACYGDQVRAAFREAEQMPLYQIPHKDTRYLTPTAPTQRLCEQHSADEASSDSDSASDREVPVPHRVRRIARRDVKQSKSTWVTVNTWLMSDGSVESEIALNDSTVPSGSSLQSYKARNVPESNAYRHEKRLEEKEAKKISRQAIQGSVLGAPTEVPMILDYGEVPEHWDDDDDDVGFETEAKECDKTSQDSDDAMGKIGNNIRIYPTREAKDAELLNGGNNEGLSAIQPNYNRVEDPEDMLRRPVFGPSWRGRHSLPIVVEHANDMLENERSQCWLEIVNSETGLLVSPTLEELTLDD